MASITHSSRQSDASQLLTRTSVDTSISTARQPSLGSFVPSTNGTWSNSSIWGNGMLSTGLLPLREQSTKLGDASSGSRLSSSTLALPANSSTWNRRSSNWNPPEPEPGHSSIRRASENTARFSALSTLQTTATRSTESVGLLSRHNSFTPALSSLSKTSSPWAGSPEDMSTGKPVSYSSYSSNPVSLDVQNGVTTTQFPSAVNSPLLDTRGLSYRMPEAVHQPPSQSYSGNRSLPDAKDIYRQFLESSAHQDKPSDDRLQRWTYGMPLQTSTFDMESLQRSLSKDCVNSNIPRYSGHTDNASRQYGSNNYSAMFPQSPPLSAVPSSPNYTYVSIVDRPNAPWINATLPYSPTLYSKQAHVDYMQGFQAAVPDNRSSRFEQYSDDEVSPSDTRSAIRMPRNGYFSQNHGSGRPFFDPNSPSFVQGQQHAVNMQIRPTLSANDWSGNGHRLDAVHVFQQSQHFEQATSAHPLDAQSFFPGVQGELDCGNLLLEDFKNSLRTNSRNRRLELSDIKSIVAQVAGDQNGSRFIQERLETAKSDAKDMVFSEILRNVKQLMMDVFGNYVCQKFFEFGTQLQKRQLADAMRGHMLQLSKNTYACRVVQKALEHILVDQQIALVNELKDEIVDLVRDANANHVIQIAISRVPIEHVQFVVDTIVSSVQYWAVHNYGCRVVQRLLERCSGITKQKMLADLHSCAQTLIADQYGNYVAQCVIIIGSADDRNKMINVIKANLLSYSRQKYASNTVEKGILYGSDKQRREIMLVLADKRENGESALPSLVRDQYGNYVIQTLLEKLSPSDRAEFISILGPEVAKVKVRAANKQSESVESKIHKFEPPRPYFSSFNPHQFNAASQVGSHNTAGMSPAPTPALTNGSAATPRSSSANSAEDRTITFGTSPAVTFKLEISHPAPA